MSGDGEAANFLKELEAEAAASPAKDAPVGSIESARALAAEVNRLTKDIASREAELNLLKIRKYNILTKDLVELMSAAKVQAFTVEDVEFKSAPYYKASIPEEHRDEAHGWLEDHEAGDLINYTITVALPKDSQEEAAKIIDYVRKNFQMAEVDQKRLVPWKRLTSWLQELYENRKVDTILPPLDIMGATVGRVVQIKEKRR